MNGNYAVIKNNGLHNDANVWFNHENGNYLFWNANNQRFQVYENVIDEQSIASLEVRDYWNILEFGNNKRYDQYMRLLPTKCPDLICAVIKSVHNLDAISQFGDNINESDSLLYVEIHDTKSYHKTNNIALKSQTLINQKLCWKPTPIVCIVCDFVCLSFLCCFLFLFCLNVFRNKNNIVFVCKRTTDIQAILEVHSSVSPNYVNSNSNEFEQLEIGKFYFSPLEQGSFARQLSPNPSLTMFINNKNITVEFDVAFAYQDTLNSNSESNGIDSTSAGDTTTDTADASNTVENSDKIGADSNNIRIIAETRTWHGIANEEMIMRVEAVNLGLNPIWKLINPDPSLNITIMAQQLIKETVEDDPESPLNLDATIPFNSYNGNATRSVAILKCIGSAITQNEFIIIAKHENLNYEAATEISVEINYKSSQNTRNGKNDDNDSIISLNGDANDPNKDGSDSFDSSDENLWILWWVLITIGFTLLIACTTFVCLKKSQKKAETKRHLRRKNQNKKRKKQFEYNNEFVSLVEDVKPVQSNRHMIHKHTMPGDGEAQHLKSLPRPPTRVSSVVAGDGAGNETRPSLITGAQSKFMQSATNSNQAGNEQSEVELPLKAEPGAI